MPRTKRQPKKIGIFQSMMKALGYIPAPKKRPGKKVSVKPYVRKSPAKVLPVEATQSVLTEV